MTHVENLRVRAALVVGAEPDAEETRTSTGRCKPCQTWSAATAGQGPEEG
jgi:hypothetical protein